MTIVALLLTGCGGDKVTYKPNDPDRDRFILSKGHACPIWYVTLNERGYFKPKVEHFHLRELGSIFQGYPSMHSGVPGIDMTTGSLGNGIAIGAGMAYAAKAHKKSYYTYVICGDGELQEGVTWEGVNMADRFRAFDRHTQEICGHDVEQIKAAVLIAKKTPGSPHAIICKTIKGRGLSYM